MKLITGLPRSRSYWLYCYFNEYIDNVEFEPPLEEVYSDSFIIDTSFTMRINSPLFNPDKIDYMKFMEDNSSGLPCHVVIHRPVKDVRASLEMYLPQSGIKDYHLPTIKELKKAAAMNRSQEALHILYRNIDKNLPRVCEFLEVPYNETLHYRMKTKLLNKCY